MQSGTGLHEERTVIDRADYDLAAAQRAFGESAVPARNADDLRMARRELETRREALARIDAELDRVAARLEQRVGARVAALGVGARTTSPPRTTRISQSLPALRTASRPSRRAPRSRAPAQAQRRAEDDALRLADADAARWQARAEALAAALDASP